MERATDILEGGKETTDMNVRYLELRFSLLERRKTHSSRSVIAKPTRSKLCLSGTYILEDGEGTKDVNSRHLELQFALLERRKTHSARSAVAKPMSWKFSFLPRIGRGRKVDEKV